MLRRLHVQNRAGKGGSFLHKKLVQRPALSVRVIWLLVSVVIAGICLTGHCVRADSLRLHTYTVRDRQMGGIPAFKVLAPEGWTLRGGLTWNINLANLVTADVAIEARDHSAGFFIHPSPMFISGPIEYRWPQGQLYLGMIVMPIPNNPSAFLQQLVIPSQRPQARDIRLVAQKDLPAWAESVAAANRQPGGVTRGFGTKARFAYTENGRRWEEDFYCVVLVSRPYQGPQNLFWLADRNLSVRAPAGQLDAMQPLANAFIASFKVERRWYGRFVQIQQQWIAAQHRGIANAGALSRAISESNDRFDQAFMQSWRNRRQAEDRASREFSEYIRGSENYRDPVNQRQVELPGGYDHAWTNALGEYVLSNDAGFDPNQNAGTDWVAIEPAP